MAALTAERATPIREGKVVRAHVGASTTIYEGGLLEILAAGVTIPARAGASRTYWGIALESITTPAGGSGTIETLHGATAHFKGDATLDTAAEKLAAIGNKAYVVDDQTVTTSSGDSSCGTIVDYDDDGVWVRLTN